MRSGRVLQPGALGATDTVGMDDCSQRESAVTPRHRLCICTATAAPRAASNETPPRSLDGGEPWKPSTSRIIGICCHSCRAIRSSRSPTTHRAASVARRCSSSPTCGATTARWCRFTAVRSAGTRGATRRRSLVAARRTVLARLRLVASARCENSCCPHRLCSRMTDVSQTPARALRTRRSGQPASLHSRLSLSLQITGDAMRPGE